MYIIYYVFNDNCTKILSNNKYFYSERLFLNTYIYMVLWLVSLFVYLYLCTTKIRYLIPNHKTREHM